MAFLYGTVSRLALIGHREPDISRSNFDKCGVTINCLMGLKFSLVGPWVCAFFQAVVHIYGI